MNTVVNKVIVVTGASQGIGLSLSKILLAQGARVVLAAPSQEELDAVSVGMNDETSFCVATDVRFKQSVDQLAEQTLARFGRIDAWVNNAGVAKHRPIIEYTEEEMDWMMDVNFKGTVMGCQSALRAMIPNRQGTIINITSTASLKGIPLESFYSATKWAVRGFTQALQEEAAPHNICVCNILPGGVDTAFWDQAVDGEMPVQDFLTPDQVAKSILQVLLQDENLVVREMVVRSIRDRDNAHLE